MRFSENGYYLESHEKCDNCGILLYERSIKATIDGEQLQFCSEWCIDWHVSRDAKSGGEKPYKGKVA
jgi:hypothetical protein